MPCAKTMRGVISTPDSLIWQEPNMPRLELTEAAVRRIKAPDPSGRQVLHWDQKLPGFGVLASGTTASKSYIVQRAIGTNGPSPRITIGNVNGMGLDKAREEAADLIYRMRKGDDPRTERKTAGTGIWTLQRALDDYIQRRLATGKIRENSANQYRGQVERYLSDWLDRPLKSITGDMVETRHLEIQQRVEERRKHRPDSFVSKAGGTTANHTMTILSTLWDYVAKRDETMPSNPVRRLDDERFEVKARKRVLGVEQLPIFYRALGGLPNQIAADAVKLMLFTGLRRHEALALRWDEVDRDKKLIRLSPDRTKNDRGLDLPMTSFVRDLLIARRALGNDGGFVFGGRGKAGHFTDMESTFKQIADICGIQVAAHDLRRTFVTVAESLDISHYALKALVNHTLGKGDVTGDHYIQMTVDRLRGPAQRVCDRLMELCEIQLPEGENIEKLPA
jgi:integrase